MTTLADLYRAERRSHSASMIYVDAPPPAQRPSIYSGLGYQGLAGYQSQERPDPLAQRPGESTQAWERRTAVHRRHGESEITEQERAEWEAHRAVVDRKLNHGVLGEVTDRASAVGSRFGGREVEQRGGLVMTAVPGSRSIRRVYVSQLQEPASVPGSETGTLRSSAEGWL